jgi:hypothetical protein
VFPKFSQFKYINAIIGPSVSPNYKNITGQMCLIIAQMRQQKMTIIVGPVRGPGGLSACIPFPLEIRQETSINFSRLIINLRAIKKSC